MARRTRLPRADALRDLPAGVADLHHATTTTTRCCARAASRCPAPPPAWSAASRCCSASPARRHRPAGRHARARGVEDLYLRLRVRADPHATFGVDYWNIEIENLISPLPEQAIFGDRREREPLRALQPAAAGPGIGPGPYRRHVCLNFPSSTRSPSSTTPTENLGEAEDQRRRPVARLARRARRHPATGASCSTAPTSRIQVPARAAAASSSTRRANTRTTRRCSGGSTFRRTGAWARGADPRAPLQVGYHDQDRGERRELLHGAGRSGELCTG